MESTSINHGPLEFVFTVDEETGLTGASEFTPGLLRSRYFLNLDGEEENTLCIGCAGGVNTVARRRLELLPAPAGQGWRVRVSGLQGGHSGIDIHKGRGNALRILGRVMGRLREAQGAAFGIPAGGSKHNAIPREASVMVVSGSDPGPAVAAVEAEVRAELGAFDPGVRISAEPAAAPDSVMADADAALIADLLASLHHGVLAMSPDIPGLVQTSTNLATLAAVEGGIEIGTSQRSSVESGKTAAAGMVATVLRLAGFEVKRGAGYPGWKPEPTSDIVRTAKALHKEILGIDPELMAVHAGLECGVIGEKHPGMQMISFGPHIVDVHSPSERLKISSVAPFWTFLAGLLERI
jgi:dipeptidase D